MRCCWGSKKRDDASTRIIQFRNALILGYETDKRFTDVKFCDNIISTSRYTILNFIPKNLIEQFSKFSNFYFLFIFILQSIKSVSITNGVPTIGIPLNFVITVNAIKDALEDRKRHQSDRLENCQSATILALSQAGVMSSTLIGADGKRLRLQSRTYTSKELKRRRDTALLSRQEKSMLEEDAVLRHMENNPAPLAPTVSLGGRSGNGARDITDVDTDTETDTFSEDRSISSDRSESRQTETARLKKHLHRQRWMNLRVGDVVCIFQNQKMPADLILIATSDARGKAFVETSSLDGETNLKVKHCARELLDAVTLIAAPDGQTHEIQSHEDRLLNASGLDCTFESSPPDPDLRAFSGTAFLRRGFLKQAVWREIHRSNAKRFGRDEDDLVYHNQISFPLTPDQLLLRGCKLCHTTWAVGVVAFTGSETKIRLNSEAAKRKCSKVEHKTHKLVLGIFLLMIGLCAFAGTMTAYFTTRPRYVALKYLGLEEQTPFISHYPEHKQGPAQAADGLKVGFQYFFTWIILFVNFVPISLVVTLGLVKSVQAWHMGIDRDMYDKKTKTFAVVRSSDLNEELGQVSYIMTDKTGTLTANVMEFRKLAIGGTTYGDGLTQMRRKLMLKAGLQPPPEPSKERGQASTPHVNCESTQLRRDLRGERGALIQKQCLLFLLNLAINHSILIDVSAEGLGANGAPHSDPDLASIKYIASSPDEEALVYGARHFDVAFISRQDNIATIRIAGYDYIIEILAYFEFTSERKRSTLICKMSPHVAKALFGEESTKYFVFLKGADSVILPRCRPDTLGDGVNFLQTYAEDCLRTLCLAYMEISVAQLDAWYQDYKAATMLMDNRESTMLASVEQLECNLTFQGVTGIEDRLATDVSGTIQALLKAGIKVWMLTGDRFETAMNIGLATELVPQRSQQILFLAERLFTADDVTSKAKIMSNKLASILASMKVGGNAGVEEILTASVGSPDALGTNPRNSRREHDSSTHLDVVSFWDGEVIRLCLQHDELRSLAYEICKRCRSVVFFRVAPQEKGDVVRMVKDFEPEAVTLAVGDGANDCNMIQTAHVGVGIKGKEGMQAFSASDYGLAEFRFLRTLLLVHGRWNYRRITKLVLHTLYKNFVFVMPTFYLACGTRFSGQKIFTESISQFYNVLLTQLPVIAFGIWDQDVDKNLSLKFPQIYRTGIIDFYFRTSTIVEWLLLGLWHSVAIYWIPFYALTALSITSVIDHVPNDFWLVSNVIFLQVMIVVNSKIMLETMCPNWINLASVLASFGFFFFLLYAQSMWPQLFPETTGVIIRMASQPMIWALSLICPTIALSFDVVSQVFNRSFKPELHHLMQFLMRFEQEEQRAKRALMLEAIRQGGPQLLSAMGYKDSGQHEVILRSRKSRRGLFGHGSMNLGRTSDASSVIQEEDEMEEFLADEGGDAPGDDVAEEIDVALAIHERRAQLASSGISNVVLELLHIKPLFETLKGGFAFTAPDTSAVPLAFNLETEETNPGMVTSRALTTDRLSTHLESALSTESARPTPSQSRLWLGPSEHRDEGPVTLRILQTPDGDDGDFNDYVTVLNESPPVYPPSPPSARLHPRRSLDKQTKNKD